MIRIALLAVLCSLVCSLCACSGARDVTLQNDLWAVRVDPGTLGLVVQPRGQADLVLSSPVSESMEVVGLERSGDAVSWAWSCEGLRVSLRLDGGELAVDIASEDAGSFTWPVFDRTEATRALIWPHWEGQYADLSDPVWVDFLVDQSPWNTLDGLTMPFFGLDCGEYMVTVIATNRYNNAIRFERVGDRLRAGFAHEFPKSKSEWSYGFVIRLSEGGSPVEPARQFRQWLQANGEFVTLKEKAKRTPRVNRLLGAANAYLWGYAPFSRHDVPGAKWKAFCERLVEEAGSESPSPGRRLKERMGADEWKSVEVVAAEQWPGKYDKSQVAGELARLIGLPELYDEASWRGVAIPAEANQMLSMDRGELSAVQVCRLNSLLVHAAYSEYLIAVNEWGDGLSRKMLDRLVEAGFDRMRLCLDGWEEATLRPDVAGYADQLGYLLGTYDSFHSIHDPKLAGTDKSWPTAQFGQELYESGAIVNGDGKKLGGFKKRGYKLSPKAARPYVEARVRENMAAVPFSYYFVDCDAFGELYDDYSPLHPSTQEEDGAARNDRLKWIEDTFDVVIGSEGGSSYSAPVIHSAEGMVVPVIGWGDEDMRDKESKYFRGRYYPPDGPEVMVKQVPLKEKYQHLYYDPRFRLPLFEVVFHDSVVATAHWGSGSLKFLDVINTLSLTELLYMVPPMYNLNLDEFSKHREKMVRHYKFFSPWHRRLGFEPMTDFEWLTPDRLVQRAVFGGGSGGTEIVVNFGQQVYEYRDVEVPARSVMVCDGGMCIVHTPLP